MTENPIYHWQDQNDIETRIIGADSYAIEEGAPQFEYEGRKGYKVTAKAIVNGRVPPVESLPAKWEDKEEIEVFALGDYYAPIWNIGFYYDSNNCWFDITHTEAVGGNIYGGYCEKKLLRVRAFVLDPTTGSARSVKVNSGGYHDPAIDLAEGFFGYAIEENPLVEPKACLNEIPYNCFLRFYKDGKLVYELETPECLEVNEVTQQCPPTTCAVDCGDHVCCVNRDGYVVDGFFK